MASDAPMQLGLVGLGRRGAPLAPRLMRDGHRLAVNDVPPDAVRALAQEAVTPAECGDHAEKQPGTDR
ncbi:NAD(P)-binding domain-containing protein [Streptomyces sp. NRRL S-87]|uniref:NAD(P)-binding domain-containing protein n=1 Tax=Streptomyces sp. NRRL S-87 TaxID=1463920 RepID=UPI0004C02611|nr:NAD(P)-binding domain-containing protein [Streptomyces sp. NRRL S-87]